MNISTLQLFSLKPRPLLKLQTLPLRCGHISVISARFRGQKFSLSIINNIVVYKAELTQKSLSSKNFHQQFHRSELTN